MVPDQGPTPEERAETMERVEAAASTIIDRLHKLSTEARNARKNIEERWLEDMRAYHGVYDSYSPNKDDVFGHDKQPSRNRRYINITRPKTNTMEAKISDLLFPVDMQNWGINPTPRPDLSEAAKQAIAQAEQAAEQANQAEAQGQPQYAEALVEQGNMQAGEAETLSAEIEEARKRARKMERQIDDQLTECGYYQKARDMIGDTCRLGTGIIKGPLAARSARRAWQQGEGGYQLGNVEGPPNIEYVRVDPWDYFPDPAARTKEDCEYEFQRHLPNRQQLLKLVRTHGFNPRAVKEIVSEEPNPQKSDDLVHLSHLRDITGEQETLTGRYVMWEYHGSLTPEEIGDLMRAAAGDDEDAIEAANKYMEDFGELEDVRVIIWFCNNKLLKISEHFPLDSGDSLFSVFSLDRAEASVLSSPGIPRIMRDPQRTLNAAWEMMLANAALSVGPQVLIDKGAVEPADGSWAMKPHKVWKFDSARAMSQQPFQSFNVPMNQEQIAGIIQLSRSFIDDETALPTALEGGDQGQAALVTQTANGMAMLFNAANLNIRRIVKNFDDDVTRGVIGRAYQWNMQFSDDDSIKGDMQIEARGTSVLLVREIQAQNLMALVERWSQHPTIAPALKIHPMLELALQSMSLTPGEVLKTADEYDQALQAMMAPEEEAPEIDEAKLAEIDARVAIAQFEARTRMQIAEMERDTKRMELAEKLNMTEEEIERKFQIKQYETDAKIEIKRLETASAERRQSHEYAAELERDKIARAEGMESEPSGGTFS